MKKVGQRSHLNKSNGVGHRRPQRYRCRGWSENLNAVGCPHAVTELKAVESEATVKKGSKAVDWTAAIVTCGIAARLQRRQRSSYPKVA